MQCFENDFLLKQQKAMNQKKQYRNTRRFKGAFVLTFIAYNI